MRVLGLLVICLFLVACAPETTTGNVVKIRDPIRDCKIENFVCYPFSGTNTEIKLNIRNQLDYDLASGTLTLLTSDCALVRPTVAIDAIPKEGDFMVTFTCKDVIPAAFDGTFVATYKSQNGMEASSKGILKYRDATE